MKEIEVKILEANHINLEPKLFELGAKKLFEKEFDVKIFDTKNKNFEKNNAILRLRKEGERAVLTHKIKIATSNGAKVNEETEIEVSDFEETIKLLEAIGFEEDKEKAGRKIRNSYQLNNIKIEFDKHLPPYDFIPEFMEIEASSVEDIYDCAEKLGFSKEDCTSFDGRDLIEYYSRK